MADSLSVSDSSDSSNEEGWEDLEPEDESQPVVGLFTDDVFPDVRAMLKECKDKHNFDLVKIQKDLGMHCVNSRKITN
jgi:protein arginine N-methyltransferase 3